MITTFIKCPKLLPQSVGTRGFSLVEMLVYISIVVVIAAAAVSVLLSLGTMVQQYQAEQSLLRSNTTILERLLFDIRTATSINFAASTLDDSNGQLSLVLPTGTVQYHWVDEAVERTAGGETIELQSDGVTITSLEFMVVPSSQSSYVHVSIESSVVTSQSTSTRWYIAGAVTRAAYE